MFNILYFIKFSFESILALFYVNFIIIIEIIILFILYATHNFAYCNIIWI